MEKTLEQISQNFLSQVQLSAAQAVKPFILATIGLPGSGRTTVAQMIAGKLPGAVLISSDSARYLLKETGLPWGENVRQILKMVAVDLLKKGYGVVFDGNAADEDDRKNIAEIANQTGAKVFYVRININPEMAKERKRAQYENPSWVSGFERFRVNTTEKMLKNIDDRVELHRKLNSADIPNLLGEMENNGSKEELDERVDRLVAKILL